MSDFLIYTISSCPFCDRAKELLMKNQLPYSEVKAESLDEKVLNELLLKSGMRTFPQIFYRDKLLGGFTDLRLMMTNGELSKLLSN